MPALSMFRQLRRCHDSLSDSVWLTPTVYRNSKVTHSLEIGELHASTESSLRNTKSGLID